MNTENKFYSNGYIYEFKFDLDTSTTELIPPKRIIGEKRVLRHLIDFLKSSFLSDKDDKIHTLNMNNGLIIISKNEATIMNISGFCEYLKEKSILLELVLIAGVLSQKYDEEAMTKKLKNDYLNYSLTKDLKINSNLGNKKVKI